MPETKRIVLSGGPGTGKTSIINELEKRGHTVFHEISREIIKSEVARKSDILPWANLPAFSEKVIQGRILQHRDAKKGVTFYDRSIVDSVAYMYKDNMTPKPHWITNMEEFRYCDFVFITPPWPTIFTNDEERKESWEALCQIHEHLLTTYTKAGYEVVLIPEMTVEERADFLLENLHERFK